VPEVNFQLLDFTPWAVFDCHHLLQCLAVDSISKILSNNLRVGVSPCQSISKKSASSKLNLVLHSILPSPGSLVLFQRVLWLASVADTLASIICSTAAAVMRAATSLASLTSVPIAMKSMQPMLLSMTPVKRYDNPKSGCESYMPAAPGELQNSIPLTVPKPLKKLKPPAPSTTQSPSETLCP
ncbi:hypothetical protein Tco_1269755, partial [Tanacetum coccineum]